MNAQRVEGQYHQHDRKGGYQLARTISCKRRHRGGVSQPFFSIVSICCAKEDQSSSTAVHAAGRLRGNITNAARSVTTLRARAMPPMVAAMQIHRGVAAHRS